MGRLETMSVQILYIRYEDLLGSLRGAVANVLDCDILISEFEQQTLYYVHFRANIFGKGINSVISSVMGWIVLLLLYGFGIK